MTFVVSQPYRGDASWQADCGCIGHGFGDAFEVEVPCVEHGEQTP